MSTSTASRCHHCTWFLIPSNICHVCSSAEPWYVKCLINRYALHQEVRFLWPLQVHCVVLIIIRFFVLYNVPLTILFDDQLNVLLHIISKRELHALLHDYGLIGWRSMVGIPHLTVHQGVVHLHGGLWRWTGGCGPGAHCGWGSDVTRLGRPYSMRAPGTLFSWSLALLTFRFGLKWYLLVFTCNYLSSLKFILNQN